MCVRSFGVWYVVKLYVCTFINYAIVPLINFVYIILDLPRCSVCIKVRILMRSGFINPCDWVFWVLEWHIVYSGNNNQNLAWHHLLSGQHIRTFHKAALTQQWSEVKALPPYRFHFSNPLQPWRGEVKERRNIESWDYWDATQ